MKRHSKSLSASDKFAVPLLWGLSVFLFILMLFISWQRWADILIDFGRELYIPWQVSQGKVLYRDLFYLYGPLAAYWDAFLFYFFGAQARTLIFFNFIVLMVLVWLIYRLVSLTACRLTASFAVFAFVAFFSLAHYSFIGNYNYLAPYSHALVYGVALAMASFLILEYYFDCPTVGRACALGCIAGFILLTKLELAVALCGALAAVFIMRYVWEPVTDNTTHEVISFFIGCALPIVSFFIFFTCLMGAKAAFGALIYPLKVSLDPGILGNPFVRGMAGMDHIADNLRQVGMVFFAYVAIVILALFASLAIGVVKHEIVRRLWRIFFVLLFLSVLVVISNRINWNEVFLPLPLFCLFFIATSCLLVRINKGTRRWAIFRVAFALFAFFLLGKILLKAHIFHYGFVLALPAFLVMLILFLHDVPALLPPERFDTRTFQVVMGGILIFGACIHVGFSFKLYNLKTYRLSAEDGQFFTYGKQVSRMGPVLEDVIKYLKGTIRKGETLIVMPEGVMLNFLLKVLNPTPYYDLIPTTIALASEGAISDALKNTPPDYVVILERDMSEYGARYFGRDYAFTIFEWVRLHYHPVFWSGAPPLAGRGFGAVVLRKDE